MEKPHMEIRRKSHTTETKMNRQTKKGNKFSCYLPCCKPGKKQPGTTLADLCTEIRNSKSILTGSYCLPVQIEPLKTELPEQLRALA